MNRNYFSLLTILLLLTTLVLFWLYPIASIVLYIFSLLVSLALFIYSIFQTYTGTENACPNILKDVGLFVISLVTTLFLGGIAAMLANAQVGMGWGEVVSTISTHRAGIVSTIGASFGVGYLVRKGVMKFAK